MKDNQKFKNWLKAKYSCSECKQELFSFLKGLRKEGSSGDYLYLFYYHHDEIPPLIMSFFSGERVCFNCYKKTIDKNGSSPIYKFGAAVSKPIEEFHKIYQEELEKLRKIPISSAELEKVIEYAKQTKLEKCSKCQNYSFFINENKTRLTEKFRLANNQKLCPDCLENFSEKIWKIGYHETKYFLYDLREAWKNKDVVVEKSIYETKEKVNPNQNHANLPISPPQNPNLERKNESKVNYWPAILVSIFPLSLIIFLAIFAFSKSKRK